MRSILVVELWNIGDVILTLPFLGQLRRLFPHATVTMLGRPHARTLLQGTGLVDDFIDSELTWSVGKNELRPSQYDWRELVRVAGTLRARDFDIAFQSKLHFREHVLLAASGARLRVGYQLDRTTGRALTHPLTPIANRQRSEDWLELLRPFGNLVQRDTPSLVLSPAEIDWTETFLAEHGIGQNAVLVAVHPGASVPAKRWPLAKFQEIVDLLASRADIRCLVFAEPGGYGMSLGEHSAGRAALAQVGLRELIALISRCNLLVCNDSGPMHIAGAVAVPTVAIFGHGINRSFAPLGTGHRLVTSAQTENPPGGVAVAVTRIPTSAVWEAVEKSLESVLTKPRR